MDFALTDAVGKTLTVLSVLEQLAKQGQSDEWRNPALMYMDFERTPAAAWFHRIMFALQSCAASTGQSTGSAANCPHCVSSCIPLLRPPSMYTLHKACHPVLFGCQALMHFAFKSNISDSSPNMHAPTMLLMPT